MIPDCMIGPSEPCAGYLELLAERDDAHKRIVELEAALAERTRERDAAIRRAEALREALDALLEVAEQSVDTRQCSLGILRAMNQARAAIDAARADRSEA